ncbi:hypothetical protein [Undibacterium sp. Ren11W]|uniref:hypothetical protein n=1 Tax=Undibacterium sp. Ren11W TaxID=3413045 RepID=UPI003BF40832
MRPLAKFLIFSGILFATASQANDKSEATQLLEQIRNTIGKAACNDQQQCKTIGIGLKACGGPELYLAWSTLATDVNLLNALSLNYRTLREEQIKAAGEISNCMAIKDPGAYCQISAEKSATGVCQLGLDGVNIAN